jgi:hypothetical protein
MHVLEGSDCAIVPMKLTNKEGKSSTESAEGRVWTKEEEMRDRRCGTGQEMRRRCGEEMRDRRCGTSMIGNRQGKTEISLDLVE